jgi:hypothetical protein
MHAHLSGEQAFRAVYTHVCLKATQAQTTQRRASAMPAQRREARNPSQNKQNHLFVVTTQSTAKDSPGPPSSGALVTS